MNRPSLQRSGVTYHISYPVIQSHLLRIRMRTEEREENEESRNEARLAHSWAVQGDLSQQLVVARS
jgi:hypothetical protein